MVILFPFRVILNSRSINSSIKNIATTLFKSAKTSMSMLQRHAGVWREMRARLYVYINFWKSGDSLTTYTRNLPIKLLLIRTRNLFKLSLFLSVKEKIVLIEINWSFRDHMERMTSSYLKRYQESSERFVTIAKE